MDFMDVDADEYSSPSEDIEDYDANDVPRKRGGSSLRGGKKKPRKKSKGSGQSPQWMTILFSILGFAVVLGGGGFALMGLTNGGGVSELDWIPTNVTGFVKVQVDDVSAAPIIQKFKASEGGKKLLEELTKSAGLPPEDLDYVVIAVSKYTNLGSNGIVFRAKKPFDIDAMSKADGANLSSHGSSVYYKKSPAEVMFFPDPKTMVRGTEAVIQGLIDRGKKHPSEAKFAFGRNYRDQIVLVALETQGVTNSPFTGMAGDAPESLLMRINVGSDVRLMVDGRYKDAATAKKSFDRTNADFEKARREGPTMAAQLEKAPPNPLVPKEAAIKVIKGITEVMSSMQMSQSGSAVTLQMTIPGQVITDFIDTAGSLPNSPLHRLPFSMGR